jgi:hypothetical protein
MAFAVATYVILLLLGRANHPLIIFIAIIAVLTFT